MINSSKGTVLVMNSPMYRSPPSSLQCYNYRRLWILAVFLSHCRNSLLRFVSIYSSNTVQFGTYSQDIPSISLPSSSSVSLLPKEISVLKRIQLNYNYIHLRPCLKSWILQTRAQIPTLFCGASIYANIGENNHCWFGGRIQKWFRWYYRRATKDSLSWTFMHCRSSYDNNFGQFHRRRVPMPSHRTRSKLTKKCRIKS